jgi:4-amino-4-deoxy-L-arabinose transferase-like glycosyltransferase
MSAPLVLWGILFVSLPQDRQQFPLNDDWAYSKGAFAFARGEGIHYYRQPSMPLLGQWLLAYPVIRMAGESHVALRLLTITLALLAILAFYDLLRGEVGLSRYQAAFTAAALALNPFFFLLSGTFMSDIPALAFSLAALALYARALRSGRIGWLAVAAVLATLAAVTRQNTLAAPLAAAMLAWRSPRLRLRAAWVAAVMVPITVGIVVNSWFNARPDAVPLSPEMPGPEQLLLRAFTIVHYLGLSALPVLALRWMMGAWDGFLVAATLMLEGAIVCFVIGEHLFLPHAYHGGLFPYLENLITPWGTFENNNYVVGDRPLMMGQWMQIGLTVAGCLGGTALLVQAARYLRGHSVMNVLTLFTLFHIALLFAAPKVYDRYLIVLMPGALAAVVAPATERSRPLAGFVLLTIFAVVSLGLMHDWLAWNSARWELGRRAVARGIAASDIEGGLEWDSWYADTPVAPEGTVTPPRGLMLPFNRNRFPQLTGRYALAFKKPQGTILLDVEPYRLWLIPGEYELALVQQEQDP